jgi:hypothetical protein
MEEVYADYQFMHYSLPDFSEGPTVDPEMKGIIDLLSNQLSILRKELQLRNKQIDQLMHLHIQHKQYLKEAADKAATNMTQLDKIPSVLLALNNSFRHDVVKLIVSLDCIEPTYVPNSH